MGLSIQDYAKKINSGLSWGTVISLVATTVFLVIFAMVLEMERHASLPPVTYIPGEGEVLGEMADARPFASRNGKTYTYLWCGTSNILEKNKIYFENEAQAIASGRTLSKLCQR